MNDNLLRDIALLSFVPYVDPDGDSPFPAETVEAVYPNGNGKLMIVGDDVWVFEVNSSGEMVLQYSETLCTEREYAGNFEPADEYAPENQPRFS